MSPFFSEGEHTDTKLRPLSPQEYQKIRKDWERSLCGPSFRESIQGLLDVFPPTRKTIKQIRAELDDIQRRLSTLEAGKDD